MKNVLVVGHCGFDGPRLVNLVDQLEEAQAERVNSTEEALQVAKEEQVDLVLFNREFTNGESGLEAIKQFKEEVPQVKVMLISNYEDAQKSAIELGAIQGFGKANMNESSLELIKNALEL